MVFRNKPFDHPVLNESQMFLHATQRNMKKQNIIYSLFIVQGLQKKLTGVVKLTVNCF